MSIAPRKAAGPGFWTTTQLFGILFFLVMGVLGMLVEASSSGCMYVVPTYFTVLVVVLPLLILRRFGAATAVFLLYVTVGSFIEYRMEWVAVSKLASPLGGLGWGLYGVLVGLSADAAYRWLPHSIPEARRAAITGAVTGCAFFLTTYLAMATLYAVQAPESHYRFFSSQVYFSLPWMVLNGGFAGYTAEMLARGVRDKASTRQPAAAT